MQIPIAYTLNYPNRLVNNIQKIDLFEIKDLVFEKPNLEKFDCLRLAFEAIKKGHSYQVALNATNEVLVDAFLNKKITYTRNSKRNWKNATKRLSKRIKHSRRNLRIR